MQFKRIFAGLVLTAVQLIGLPMANCADIDKTSRPKMARAQADTVYRNGFVYTVDAKDGVQQALAIRGGQIIYVGSDSGAAPFIGAHTAVLDLHGRMMMPGLVDGHMHPLMGGAALVKCNLNYER